MLERALSSWKVKAGSFGHTDEFKGFTPAGCLWVVHPDPAVNGSICEF